MQYSPIVSEKSELNFTSFADKVIPLVKQTSQKLSEKEILSRLSNDSDSEIEFDYVPIREGDNRYKIVFKGKIVGILSYKAKSIFGGGFVISEFVFTNIDGNELDISKTLEDKGILFQFNNDSEKGAEVSHNGKVITIRAPRSLEDVLHLMHEVGHTEEDKEDLAVRKYMAMKKLELPDFKLEVRDLESYESFEDSIWPQLSARYGLADSKSILTISFNQGDLEEFIKYELKAWFNSYKFSLTIFNLLNIPFEEYEKVLMDRLVLSLSSYYKKINKDYVGKSMEYLMRENYKILSRMSRPV